MPSIDSTLIRLRDGRHLCVADQGDPDGVPVFFLHGGPGSRRASAPVQKKAGEFGIRLLTPDRPGSGFSEPKPGRTVLDFADDIADVADALGLDRFAVFGGSGGAPYALACAYSMPERITLTIAASSPGNGKADRRMREGYHGIWKLVCWAARTSPYLLLPVVALMLRPPKPGRPETAKEKAMRAEAPAWLLEAESFELARESVQEMRRQGLLQPATDLHVIFSRWGFDPQQVTGRVHLWHGLEDDAVPIESGRRLAEQIPNVVTHFVPGGHEISLFRGEEVFAELAASFKSTVPTR